MMITSLNKKRSVLLFIVSLNLIGCATTPIPPSQAKSVINILDNAYTPNGNNEITIIRESGFFGAGCSIEIIVNNSKVSYLNSSEKITLSLKNGNNLIAAKKSSLCGGDYRSISINTNNGYAKIYELGFGTNGDFYFQPYIEDIDS